MNLGQSRNRLTDTEHKLMVTSQRRVGEDGLGVWDGYMRTIVYGMTGPQGPAVEHRELYPVFCDMKKESEKECFFVLFCFLSFCHFLGRSRGIWEVPRLGVKSKL